jgi:tetratricopeptide (TPR) repeat protein
VLIRAVAIAELHVVPDQYPNSFLYALHILCDVYVQTGEYGRAQPIAERQLALVEQFNDPDHPEVGAALTNVALCLEGQGKHSEALSLYERHLAINERVYGPNHTEVGTTLVNIGGLYRKQGDHRRAKGVLERALAIDERALGPQHLVVAHTLSQLAHCCYAAGDLTQAKTLYERALAIYEPLGRTHPETATILANLATLATETGRPRQAAALAERAAVAADVAEHQPCGWCGRMAVHRAKFCGRCKMVWYCDKECQRAAWPCHKPHCHGKPAPPQ